MKQIFLIAWREYKQYVLSRGFILFLFMFPLGFVAISAAIGLIEKNKPVRSFVVVDQTDQYIDDIDREIERRRLLSAIVAWDSFLLLNVKPEDLEAGVIEAPFAPAFVNNQRLLEFVNAGGFDAARAVIAPYLRSGVSEFSVPPAAFVRLALPEHIASENGLSEVEDMLRPYLLKERTLTTSDGNANALFAAVILPDTFGAGKEDEPAQYWSRNLTDNSLQELIASALSRALRRDAIAEFGLHKEALDELSAISAPINSFRPDKEAAEAELDAKDRVETILPAVLTYMLLIIIFGAGNLLLTNTIEERSNKIVEILLSSVTADQLMIGKLIGIAAVGLTMPTIFLIGGVIVSLFSAAENSFMQLALETLFTSPLILIYLFYFFCAYAIFAMVFLAIGAVSNSLQDAQSYMGPVMLLVFAPLPFMVMVFQNPNGVVASVLTWIPIYTPYAVLMRAASDPPLWEIIGATVLMLIFAGLLMRFMGRIFRQAILQASPPKARAIWRLGRSGNH